jgi:hypothetical protein
MEHPEVLAAPKSKQRIPGRITCTFHAGQAALIKIIRKWSQNLKI